MATTYYLRTLNPDGSERDIHEASSPTALGALIHEITVRRHAGESDELMTRHDDDEGQRLSVHFDIARNVDGEARAGLREAEKDEMYAEVRRRGEATGSGGWMSEGPSE